MPAPVRPTIAVVVPGSAPNVTPERIGRASAARSASYENVSPRAATEPERRSPVSVSSASGSASQMSSMRFHEAVPRCQRLTTHPSAIAGQISSVM